jgi:Mg-chelatase subunit ChlD
MTDSIIKKPELSGIQINKGKLRTTASPFQQRVNAAKETQADAATLPNRICLMLDKSSSMAHYERGNSRRIDLLKDAFASFVSRCDLSTTALAAETFPPSIELALTNVPHMIDMFAMGLDVSGNTPMHACVERCLGKVPMTRGIIVSDGEATDWGRSWYEDPYEPGHYDENAILKKYKEAGIPIDCVHISTDSGGEELLKRIASITGGIFIKFTDVSAFSTAFGYLAPGYRAMLTDGRVSASDIGAREVQS